MADLNLVKVPVNTGVVDIAAQAVAATAGGDAAPVGTNRFLYINNASAATITVTVVSPGTADGLAIADASLAVAAGKHGMLPLGDVYRGANGRAAITYSGVTTLTVAAFELRY